MPHAAHHQTHPTRHPGRPGPRRVLIAVAILGTPWASTPTLAADDPDGVAFFEAKIRPVLVERCYSCHSCAARRPKGGLRLDSRESMRQGGNSGPAVVPGNLQESLLILAIEQEDEAFQMPPRGKLPEPVIADFRRWVEMGAPDPRLAPTPPT